MSQVYHYKTLDYLMFGPQRQFARPVPRPAIVTGGTFTPASISGLQVWFRADQGVLNSSGAAVRTK